MALISYRIRKLKSEKDKLIGEYVINHNDILKLSANEISEQCYCSVSSISRFCRRVGASNFQELKFLVFLEQNLDTFVQENSFKPFSKINSTFREKKITNHLNLESNFLICDTKVNFKIDQNLIVPISYSDYLDLDPREKIGKCLFYYGSSSEEVENLIMEQLSYIYIFSTQKDTENYDSYENVCYIHLENDYLTKDYEFINYLNLIYLTLKEV